MVRPIVLARLEFLTLQLGGRLTPEHTARLGVEAAGACWQLPAEMPEAVRLLAELAALPEPELARGGVDGIFRHAVESMGDAFDPALCDRYIEFFAQVIQHARALPAAQALDARLRRFGVTDLVARARAVRGLQRVPRREGIRKILVLSRVTLGAEVAVTSVILGKMMRLFPQARLVLLAGHKAALLFAGESRVQARTVEYPRGGGLLERLETWAAVADAVEAETAGLTPEQYLVIDPDSRLTQLGMLPLLPDESPYHFFESRSFSRPGKAAVAELTAAWIEETFGEAGALQPWVSLAGPPVARAAGERRVSVNFGVGDNPAKRIPDPFERGLLIELLRTGWRVILDRGDGADELARSACRLAEVREGGWCVAEIGEGDSAPEAHLVAFRGSLAGFASLIAASDLYIGYDSAGQHIAAALGVKTIDIFAGFRSPRMVERWRPTGPGEVRMIVVDPDQPGDPAAILAAVLEAAR